MVAKRCMGRGVIEVQGMHVLMGSRGWVGKGCWGSRVDCGECTSSRNQWEGWICSKSTWLLFIYLFSLGGGNA